MTDTLARPDTGADIIERVIAAGDLARLSSEERTRYYGAVCSSLGLNPLTRPFEFLTLSGKMVLYATRGATDQLRRIHHVSTQIVSRETVNDCYVVTARATDRSGRSDESIGAVAIGGLKGEAFCNAVMKGETKAKRRATLAIVGLSFLDELELETIPGARVHHDEPTGHPAGSGHAGRQALAEPGERSPKAEAAVAEWEATVAEADAIVRGDPDRETGEIPGPNWGTSALGKQVSLLWDQLMIANETREARGLNPVRNVLPPDNASEAELRQWIAARERTLKALETAAR